MKACANTYNYRYTSNQKCNMYWICSNVVKVQESNFNLYAIEDLPQFINVETGGTPV